MGDFKRNLSAISYEMNVTTEVRGKICDDMIKRHETECRERDKEIKIRR